MIFVAKHYDEIMIIMSLDEASDLADAITKQDITHCEDSWPDRLQAKLFEALDK